MSTEEDVPSGTRATERRSSASPPDHVQLPLPPPQSEYSTDHEGSTRAAASSTPHLTMLCDLVGEDVEAETVGDSGAPDSEGEGGTLRQEIGQGRPSHSGGVHMHATMRSAAKGEGGSDNSIRAEAGPAHAQQSFTGHAAGQLKGVSSFRLDDPSFMAAGEPGSEEGASSVGGSESGATSRQGAREYDEEAGARASSTTSSSTSSTPVRSELLVQRYLPENITFQGADDELKNGFLVLKLKKPSTKKCIRCGAVDTPQWRNITTQCEGGTRKLLYCNACGLHFLWMKRREQESRSQSTVRRQVLSVDELLNDARAALSNPKNDRSHNV
eukprot:TRINITY_DN9917_c0_g1_i1.p1 TRINITY_DN9917_c0_g1~~TRINITY_DN9917_c0_g1_i1.p1  ORF type:complete len:328 (-),score=53.19 TRINITY_DN9917_c0_g1_i1:335-1318(-)